MSDGSSSRRARLIAWALPLAYALLIFVQSSFALPAHSLRTPRHADKVIHVVEYAILAALLARALHVGGPTGPERTRTIFLLASLASALYGVSDELHQSFVPGRHASLGDAVADAVGSLLGAGVTCAWLRRRD